MKVLIVDDSAEDRKILRYNFERHECEVEEAVDGQDGLEKAIIRKPDLIVSDALMPNMDGFQLLRALKRSEMLRDAPFVFYSAVYTGYKEEELALSLGADAFIVKPMDMDEFWEELTKILDKCRIKRREPIAELIHEEEEYLRRYSHIVATKLEEKIMELEKANKKIKNSEQCYRNLFESMRDVIVIADQERVILDVNQPAMRDIFGYETGEIVGKSASMLYADEESFEFAGREAFYSKEPVKGKIIEALFRKKNGDTFNAELYALKLVDDEGRPAGNIGLIRDITGRRRAESERAQLWSIFEASRNEIYIFSSDTLRFRYVNSGALNNIGYSLEEMKGMTPLDIKPEFTERSFREMVEPLLSREKEKTMFQTVHRRKDGSVYPVEVYLQLIEQGGRRDLLAVILDISERRKLEAQLRQAQKMEAIGLLAGGVAHDFNNVLTAIIGYSNILLLKMPKDDPNRMYLEQILSASERAASLTTGLLTFSRKQVINPQPVDVNDIIKRVEKLLRRLIGEDIELKAEFAGNNMIVMADSGQIEQILMNLATNARDAMPDGGTMTIETEIATIDQEYVNTHGFGKIGKYALISFTDSGAGMDEKTRERIFEPFFTTKELGKGTGLGLSIVYGSVKQHNGFINCYSEPGKGTTFKIYLPLIYDETEKKKTAETAEPAGGTETVLVAEDDTMVRKLTRLVLEDAGYKVIEAEDGEDALNRFLGLSGEIGIVVLDVIMPKRNGMETLAEMRKARPDVRALFMSGYTAEIIHKKGILDLGLPFISKPISPRELLKKVREILDAG